MKLFIEIRGWEIMIKKIAKIKTFRNLDDMNIKLGKFNALIGVYEFREKSSDESTTGILFVQKAVIGIRNWKRLNVKAYWR